MVWVQTSHGCWDYPSRRLSIPVYIFSSQLKGSCSKNPLECEFLILPKYHTILHPTSNRSCYSFLPVQVPLPTSVLEISRYLFYSLSKQLSVPVWKLVFIWSLLISFGTVTLTAILVLWYPMSYRNSLKLMVFVFRWSPKSPLLVISLHKFCCSFYCFQP